MIIPDGIDAMEKNCPHAGVLTMAFVNSQPLERVYTPAEALKAGSLFPDIDKPLKVGGCVHE